jgi:ABC-type transport system involved in cytochrome bd biosynthesis fused ATPase/permease subunit
VAIESAGIVLASDDPRGVVAVATLSKAMPRSSRPTDPDKGSSRAATCPGRGPARLLYLTPSDGVRSLAISRILARYAENLVSRAATLGRLTRLRAGIFRDAGHAGPEPLRRLGNGEALDRAMSDASTLDRVPIRAIVPALLAIGGMGASTAVIASSQPG